MIVPARFATPRGDSPSDGHRVAALFAELGFELLPWQAQVLEVGLELDGPHGLPIHRDVVITTPRQQGKSLLMLGVILGRLLLLSDQVILFGAQSRLTARSRLIETWWPMLARSSFGSFLELARGSGFETLRNIDNGSALRLLSTEEASGHGDTADLVVVDEAWSLDERVEQAVRPATVARRGSQIWTISTAGTAKSTWWRSKVDAGREGVGVYFEWSAAEDADPLDPATWRAAMPALDVTVPIEVIRQDFAQLSLSQARRAYLNQWTDSDDDGWNVISEEAWAEAAWAG